MALVWNFESSQSYRPFLCFIHRFAGCPSCTACQNPQPPTKQTAKQLLFHVHVSVRHHIFTFFPLNTEAAQGHGWLGNFKNNTLQPSGPIVPRSCTQRARESSQNSSLHKVCSQKEQLCSVSTNCVAFRIPRARAELPAKSKELLGLNAIPEPAALHTPLDLELSPLLAVFQHFHTKN